MSASVSVLCWLVGEGEGMYSGLYCRLITLALLGRMDQRKAKAFRRLLGGY